MDRLLDLLGKGRSLDVTSCLSLDATSGRMCEDRREESGTLKLNPRLPETDPRREVSAEPNALFGLKYFYHRKL